ncbi:MAG: ferredoxin family 2Fe-2S iron-sulfur cluster binding protein [Alphaproteobacteria bacterium]
MPRVTFVNRDGSSRQVEAEEGVSVLEVAQRHNIDIEGACEGSLACATCHVVVETSWFDKLPAATGEEEDMLDLAFGLSATSRLCCQIVLTRDMDGLTVRLPQTAYNQMVNK